MDQQNGISIGNSLLAEKSSKRILQRDLYSLAQWDKRYELIFLQFCLCLPRLLLIFAIGRFESKPFQMDFQLLEKVWGDIDVN